jgi:hypothetical protein
MKKIFSILTILSLSVIFLTPLAASAEDVPDEVTKCTMRHDLESDTNWAKKGFDCPWGTTATEKTCSFESPTLTCGSCCMMDTIYTITDWIFLAVVAIAMIMIFIGAFNIVTAGGSPEKVNTGRSYIIFAAVGIIVALIAKLIPVIAKNIIGLG